MTEVEPSVPGQEVAAVRIQRSERSLFQPLKEDDLPEVEKVSKDPLSVGQLKLRGDELMGELKLAPGPKIGAILDVLLAKVIDDPKLNKKEDLLKMAKELENNDLEKLLTMAKEKIQEERNKEDEKTKGKYWVK